MFAHILYTISLYEYMIEEGRHNMEQIPKDYIPNMISDPVSAFQMGGGSLGPKCNLLNKDTLYLRC